jgi:hypothetical protein
MAQSSFRDGDRVKLCYTRGVVREGTPGTVQRVFPFIDAFDVIFDGYHGVRLAWGRDLERADDSPDLERTVAAG